MPAFACSSHFSRFAYFSPASPPCIVSIPSLFAFPLKSLCTHAPLAACVPFPWIEPRPRPAAFTPCPASPREGFAHYSEAAGEEEEDAFAKFDKPSSELHQTWKPQQEDNALTKAAKLDNVGLGTAGGHGKSDGRVAGTEGRNTRRLHDGTLVGDDHVSAADSTLASLRNVARPLEWPTADDVETEEIAALANGNLEEVIFKSNKEENGQQGSNQAETALFHPTTQYSIQEEFDQVNEPTFRLTLRQLLDAARVETVLVIGDQNIEITGIQQDSRQVCPGDMFVCCEGYTTDGHLCIAEAAEKGAVVVVTTKQVSVQETVQAVVLVQETMSILSALSAAFYGEPSRKLSVIGITGTNGKTTTSYLLKSIYEAMERRTGLLGTIAYFIDGKKLEASNTTPDAVSLQRLMATMVHNNANVCIMEVSSHGLALDRCKEVDFDVAVFTNLTRDHLDFHKTEQAYKEAKGRLFAKMKDPKRHVKVVNIDDQHAPYFISLGNPDVPVVTFSMENRKADIYPLEVELSLSETDVLLHTPRGDIMISSGLLGRHNVYNILTAVAVGIAVNAPLKEIVRGIEEVHGVSGRCERINGKQTFAVIVDYAHTPDALSRLLDTIRECGARRIITVVGCGGDRDRGKRPIMAKIAADKSEVSIFTSDNPRTEDPLSILDDMLTGVGWSMRKYLEHHENDSYPLLQNGCRLFVQDKRAEAIRAAVAMGQEGDAVVIAGKGHETYQIIGYKKYYFNDSEECHKALRNVHVPHATM